MALSRRNNVLGINADYITELGVIPNHTIPAVKFDTLDSAIGAEQKIQDESIKRMQTNLSSMGKIQDELTKIKVDNPYQKSQLDKAKTAYGLNNDSFKQLVSNLDNPAATFQFDRSMAKLVSDPVVAKTIRDGAIAEKFAESIPAISDPRMRELAIAEHAKYTNDTDGTYKAENLNVDQFKPIDVASAYMQALKEMAPLKSTEVEVIKKDGTRYIEKSESRDENALANVKAAMMDNPIIKNNLIAKGVIDADGNTVKDANGRDYFDLLLLGVKDGNRSIDSYRPGPTATSGSSKGSKRGSRSTSNVVDTTTDSTGNKTQVLNTGQSIKTSVDGTVTVTDPDGTVSRTMPNGDVVSTTTEGKVTRREGAAAEFRAAAKAATTSAPVVQKAESKSSSKGSKSAPTSEYVVKAGGEINIPDNIAPTGGGIISTPGEPFTPVSIFTPKKNTNTSFSVEDAPGVAKRGNAKVPATKPTPTPAPSKVASGLLQAKKEVGRTLTNEEKKAVKKHIESGGDGDYKSIIKEVNTPKTPEKILNDFLSPEEQKYVPKAYLTKAEVINGMKKIPSLIVSGGGFISKAVDMTIDQQIQGAKELGKLMSNAKEWTDQNKAKNHYLNIRETMGLSRNGDSSVINFIENNPVESRDMIARAIIISVEQAKKSGNKDLSNFDSVMKKLISESK